MNKNIYFTLPQLDTTKVNWDTVVMSQESFQGFMRITEKRN